MSDEIPTLANKMIAAQEAFDCAVRKKFPIGSLVTVGTTNPVIGIVFLHHPGALFVDIVFENGNVWTKPLALCNPYTGKIPTWFHSGKYQRKTP